MDHIVGHTSTTPIVARKARLLDSRHIRQSVAGRSGPAALPASGTNHPTSPPPACRDIRSGLRRRRDRWPDHIRRSVVELEHRFEVPVGVEKAWTSLLDLDQV